MRWFYDEFLGSNKNTSVQINLRRPIPLDLPFPNTMLSLMPQLKILLQVFLHISSSSKLMQYFNYFIIFPLIKALSKTGM